MRRGAAVLMVLAACREPSSHPVSDAGADHGGSIADGANDGSGSKTDVTAPSRDGAAPPDVESPDSTPPDIDADKRDVTFDLANSDIMDAAGGFDQRVSDGCGSLHRAHLPFAMSAVDAADATYGDDATDAHGADATVDLDANTDGDARDATLDEVCYSLETEFRTFVRQNNACVDASDCFYVIGARDCSCHMRGIGSDSGSGVSVSARAETESYIARWSAAGCESWSLSCVMDILPSDGVQCIGGKCVANQVWCHFPPPEPRPEPCQ
jgi:hypothetical protein